MNKLSINPVFLLLILLGLALVCGGSQPKVAEANTSATSTSPRALDGQVVAPPDFQSPSEWKCSTLTSDAGTIDVCYRFVYIGGLKVIQNSLGDIVFVPTHN